MQLTDLLIALSAAVLFVLIITHDPPSGYNMGTGDSWFPAVLCLVVLVAALIGKFH